MTGLIQTVGLIAYSFSSPKVALAPLLLTPTIGPFIEITQQANVIKTVVIRGNQRVSREAIMLVMRSKVGQPYVQADLDADRQRLDDMGFFRAVDVRAKPLEAGAWEIDVDLDEWPTIKEIRVTGNTAVKTEDILKAISLKPGDVFNRKAVRPSSDAITQLYGKKGYFAGVADFAPLKDSPTTLNIQIQEFLVGTVSIKRDHPKTSMRVLRRLIKTKEGDPFSLDKWRNDLKRLYDTQWFESVRSEQDDQTTPGKVNLTANLKETTTGTFGLGVQIDPRSSFAGFVRLSDANFRGTGDRVGVNFLQSATGDGPSLDLDYGRPFIDSKDTSLSLQLYSRLVYRFAGTAFGGSANPTDTNRYTERHTGGAVAFSRDVSPHLNLSLGTTLERIKTNGLSTKETSGFIKQDGDVGTISMAAIVNRKDTEVEPSRGSWLRVAFEPGIAKITDIGGDLQQPGLLGTHAFARTSVEFHRYWSPGQPPRKELDDPRRVIALRVQYGAVAGTVPFFEQFFVGGSDTLRGYEEDRYWGKQMFGTTLEYRHPVQKSFNIIGFVDYAGAWDGFGSVNKFTQSSKAVLHLGYGAGIAFRTPLGPIRLDIGFDQHGKSRTHFLIGTSF